MNVHILDVSDCIRPSSESMYKKEYKYSNFCLKCVCAEVKYNLFLQQNQQDAPILKFI